MTSLDDQLLHAIDKNDIPNVSLLIEKGVNVNNSMVSPLCFAAQLGRVEIMTMLLDAGADIDAGRDVKNTACYAAISSNCFDALKLLVDRGARINGEVLEAATEFAFDDKTILLLLDAGASLDDLTSDPLMELVAKPSSIAVLKRLLARNVDVRALKGVRNRTLCHYVSVSTSSDDNVDKLIRAVADAGVDVNAVDDNLSAPLHLAAKMSSARVLVELGADIDQQDDFGRTPLHLVCGWPRKASDSFAEVLLALGASVHLANKRDQTACHVAASKQHSANLCACLAAGGDLDQPDDRDSTVRTIAAFFRFKLPTPDEIGDARRRITKIRLDFVRQRALQICIGLQPLNINALELCEIMRHSFGALGSLISFHHWWAIATTVKHFHDRNNH